MRTIKFRAWDVKTKKMIAPKKGWGVDSTGEYVWADYSYEIGDKNKIIMQFSGLLDRNLVEVYEDDIVKFQYRFISLSAKEWDDGKRISDVEKETEWRDVYKRVSVDYGCFNIGYPLYFHEITTNIEPYDNGKYTAGFSQTHSITKDRLSYQSQEYRNFEVVGNIYENPKLLEINL